MQRLAVLFGIVSLSIASSQVGDDAPKPQADDKAQLAKVQQLVGQWRGVGQPQRGSTKDSWVEEADWQWSFAGGISLFAKLPEGKYFSKVKLTRGEKEGQYVLAGTPADGSKEVRFTGQLDEAGKLQLVADEQREGLPHRISFRFVAGGDRLLVLLERKSDLSDQFVRLAEVGYTRKGSGFGKGSSGPECVVTGGFGSIEVSHKGQKYYVCCTGCLEYFNDNPDEVIAEYVARKAAEKAEREKKE
jgi:YHS domain-containing protein